MKHKFPLREPSKKLDKPQARGREGVVVKFPDTITQVLLKGGKHLTSSHDASASGKLGACDRCRAKAMDPCIQMKGAPLFCLTGGWGAAKMALAH